MKCYPENTPERFDFHKVIERVAARCSGERAKDLARRMRPTDEMSAISDRLNQTSEALQIVDNGLYFPEVAFPNISVELGMLEAENAVLEGSQAVKLLKVAETAAAAIRFLNEKREEWPALREIVHGLSAAKELMREIERVVEPNGFVKSSASRELAAARKALTEARQRANRIFEGAVRKYKKLGWLRDFEESVYNDRRVLAVEAEHKRKIEGTLHGTSETGHTAFLEPAVLVNANNETAEARQREQREEWKVLRALTAEIRPWRHTLEAYEHALAQLDFTFAKARYAKTIGGAKPELTREKDLELIDARHPLLMEQNTAEGKPTVPMSLGLDHQKRILVVSGPNAGGKSVSLKTFGLLQIMFQSGMLVPAAAQSRMGVFRQIFVDIGDDQSIAYELSTYSSRLVKMKYFLEFADKNTLFFIDEFGTGSDPELGGAIAEAILERLADTNAYGVITTHYANLKIAAENHRAMVNGCMLFDEETLAPKYVLHVGHAGSSYTFEVARKIGLDTEVIDRAKSKLDKHKVALDALLVTLQTKKNKLNKETSILEREKSKLRKEMEEYKSEADSYREKRENLNFGENKRLIEQGKKYQELIDGWKEKKLRGDLTRKLDLAAQKDAAKTREKDRTEKLREKQERIKKQKANRRRAERETTTESKIPEPGDTVHLPGTKEKGVVEAVDKGKATVVFGMVRTIVPLEKLRPAK